MMINEKKASEYLEKFYAVTVNGSLYSVKILGSEEIPVVIKIKDREGSSSGVVCGGKLEGGTMVFIGECVNMFKPIDSKERPKKIVDKKDVLWGGHTSYIAALFLSGDDALFCQMQENLETWDLRWKNQTIATLNAIGKDHPRCLISEEKLELIDPNNW